MGLFNRIRRERDINSTNLGKNRQYRLIRGDKTLSFKGKLLGFYHAEGDCLEQAAQNQTHLQSIAIFRTQTQYLIWYVLNYVNNEHLSGKHVHVHATGDMAGAAKFIEAMAYVNKRAFYPAVVEDAMVKDG